MFVLCGDSDIRNILRFWVSTYCKYLTAQGGVPRRIQHSNGRSVGNSHGPGSHTASSNPGDGPTPGLDRSASEGGDHGQKGIAGYLAGNEEPDKMARKTTWVGKRMLWPDIATPAGVRQAYIPITPQDRISGVGQIGPQRPNMPTSRPRTIKSVVVGDREVGRSFLRLRYKPE